MNRATTMKKKRRSHERTREDAGNRERAHPPQLHRGGEAVGAAVLRAGGGAAPRRVLPGRTPRAKSRSVSAPRSRRERRGRAARLRVLHPLLHDLALRGQG